MRGVRLERQIAELVDDISPPINPSRKPAPSCRSTTASRSARARSSGSRSPAPRRDTKRVARILNFRKRRAFAKPIIVETDGGMVPIVAPSCEGKTSARARGCLGGRRSCRWRTRKGAGRRFMRAGSRAKCKRPGAGCFAARFALATGRTHGVHAVGDGAPWIVGQVEEQFADQGRTLIDFYHVCEYLAAASRSDRARPGRAQRLSGDAKGRAQKRAS